MLPEHAFAAQTTWGIVSNSCVFYRQMLPLQLAKANGDSHLVRVLPTIHNEPLRRINVLPWPWACTCPRGDQQSDSSGLGMHRKSMYVVRYCSILQFFVHCNVQVMHLLLCSFAVDVIFLQAALEAPIFAVDVMPASSFGRCLLIRTSRND